jgi:hypothetical protein
MENDNIIKEGSQPELEKSSPGNNFPDTDGIAKPEGTFWEKIRANDRLFRVLRNLLYAFISILIIFFLIIFFLYLTPGIKELNSGPKSRITNDAELRKSPGYKKQIGLMTKDIERLKRKYSFFSSGQTYIIINTTENKFYLYKNKLLIREGSCSTGSYKKLQTQEGKSWTFKTPRGKFEIQAKRTHPAWHKPDWAFIEEGLPIPPKDSPLRWEAGVLGDYAMDIGDSYMIHGTIYKRFLGMPVTHGCVRLNDEDLEFVFNTLNVGSKVYIY